MKLSWPLQSHKITQGFGNNPIADRDIWYGNTLVKTGEYIYARFGLKGHNGWDFVVPTGTPIYAVHNGRLDLYPDMGKGLGNNSRIAFEEDGFVYDISFGHQLKFEGEGRQVKEGEVIGYVDSTGFSSTPHLHFGIRKFKDGKIVNYNNGFLGYFDPMPYMKGFIMPQIATQNLNGELRMVAKASSVEEWKALGMIYGFDPDAPVQENVVLKK